MARKSSPEKSRVLIEGEMTIYRSAELKQILIQALGSSHELEVDLGQVTEIDSSGMQLMIALKLESSLSDKVVRFVGHSPGVLEVLDRYDLGGFFGDPLVLQSHENR